MKKKKFWGLLKANNEGCGLVGRWPELVSPLYKVIHPRISQSLAVDRKNEILDTITASKKLTKQQLLKIIPKSNFFFQAS